MHQSSLMYLPRMAASGSETSGAEVLRLLGDEQRWRLLEELAKSDLRVGELVDRLDRPQNLVSYHLAELRRAGLVSSRRSSADGRDTYYRFDVGRCGELLCAAGAALTPALQLRTHRVEPTPLRSGRHRGRRPMVLFVCTGNSARSQMAEALIEHLSAGAVRARSAGSHPKALHPNAVRVMAERGLDISGCKTKHLDRFTDTRFDRVITLCDKVREICPELPGSPVNSHWSMPDPAASGATDEASYPAFVRAADELETRIQLLLTELSVATTKEATHAV
jgi:ArsR family transcriptional regulator, arsenate/arsenite/antimonite-responsive transcriptional repressor / arsenate reductase (thioredoxin)